MKLNTPNMQLYPLTVVEPKIYRGFGTIDLYDENNVRKSTVFFEVPKCYYDENNNELIALEADND